MVLNEFRIVADDLGLAVSVNDGILALLMDGAIYGASILPTGSAFLDAVNKINGIKDANIGVHLTLVEEVSMLPPRDIKSLIGSGGRFYKNHRIFTILYLLGWIKLSEIERELREQILACTSRGIKPRFLNSHQHLHLLPGIMSIAIKLAVEFKIPYIRLVSEPIYGRSAGLTRKFQAIILNVLSRLAVPKLIEAGLSYNNTLVGFLHAGNIGDEDIAVAKKYNCELNCHPGYEDELLRRRYSGWGIYNWERELNLFKRK